MTEQGKTVEYLLAVPEEHTLETDFQYFAERDEVVRLAGPTWEVDDNPEEVSFQLNRSLGSDCMRQSGHMLVDAIMNREFAGSFVCDVGQSDDKLSFTLRARKPIDKRLVQAISSVKSEDCS